MATITCIYMYVYICLAAGVIDEQILLLEGPRLRSLSHMIVDVYHSRIAFTKIVSLEACFGVFD